MMRKITIFLTYLVLILMTLVFLFLTTYSKESYIMPTIKPRTETGEYIIFENMKTFIGEPIGLPVPKNNFVWNSRRTQTQNNGYIFTLIGIKKDSITIRNEQIGDKIIKDKDCLLMRPRNITDVFYKYCFSLSNVNSIINITYEFKTEGWLVNPESTASSELRQQLNQFSFH